MAKVLPSLDESEPVHGDVETVQILTDVHAVCACNILSLLERNISFICMFDITLML